MRVAIYENLPLGGAKRAAYEHGRYLAVRHEIDLYRLSTTPAEAFDLAPLARQTFTYRFSPLRGALEARIARGKLTPRSYTMFHPLQRVHRQIAADVAGRGYDVVLAHVDSYTQAPRLLRWIRSVPTVYFCQEPFGRFLERHNLDANRLGLRGLRFGGLREAEYMWTLWRLHREDQRSTRAATAIAANSLYSRERIWAAYERNATVCYLGVDLEGFSPAPSPRRLEVLSVGVASAVKGHDLTIAALGLVPRETPRPALRIVMPWPGSADALRRLADAQQVDLILESAIDDVAMPERYRGALATVCASRLEPFGLTALESMASGTPVIAIREGGFRETVQDGRTGLLVDPEPRALARAIQALVQDPTRAARLGEQGRAHAVAAWGWERGARQLERLLEATAARSAAN
jgi:glycosyltransferase involved in cell wall biosynthesis